MVKRPKLLRKKPLANRLRMDKFGTNGDVYLLAGLGNPGRKYKKTRHNVGFMVVDRLASTHGFKINVEKFDANFVKLTLFDKELCIVKPACYMNLSGLPVRAFMKHFCVTPERLLVVHDDIDMPLGRLKIVFASGHGGHNGVRSIIENIGSNEFYRLKLGVGRPPLGVDPSDYVLGGFESEEKDIVDDMIDFSVAVIERFYTNGVEDAKAACGSLRREHL